MNFESIYHLYFKDVFLYLCSLSANEDVAEEITQEVFTVQLILNFGMCEEVSVKDRRVRNAPPAKAAPLPSVFTASILQHL